MKILLVIPTLKQGGAERVMSELANEFCRKGHEVHLCLLARGEHFYSVDTNVTVHNLGFENRGKLQKILSELKVFFELRRIMKTMHPSFVLSFMTKYNALSIMAASFLDTKVFVSDRSNPKSKLPTTVQILRKLTYKHATGIVAQTSLAQTLLKQETGQDNIKVIANPIKEIVSFPKIQREYIVLNVGRLVPEKGQKYLLEAFAKLNNTAWKLVILGDGPLRVELEKQAIKLGIDDRVEMPGAVKNVDEWLAKASIFAFPSISEGFPNALVEAMGAGLPCVSFDCDAGPRDLIDNGSNGFLVPLHDVDLFAKKLIVLTEDEKERQTMGKKASTIQEGLELSTIADEYLKFCQGDTQ